VAVLPERGSLDARPVPDWYTDAKLGIFVHWGLYSIPAFAEPTGGDYTTFMRDLTAGKDTRGRIPYAEWYLNALRVPGSPTARHHQATYGTDFSYFDFQAPFDQGAAKVDFARWAQLFARAGARYVVMVTRHLDGYPLWPTLVANPYMPPGYRSRRDLVGELTGAVRAAGLPMGLYYAGGIDRTFTRRPIRTMADLMGQQALGAGYAGYALAQWTELIDAYRPSVLGNDVGWPAESGPHRVMAHYYNTVADGVVNDRWTQVRGPANRLVRSLYLRFVTLASKRWPGRAGRCRSGAQASTPTSRPTSTPRLTRRRRHPGALSRPWPLPRVQRPGDRRRHPHRHPAGPSVGRCRRPRRQPADQRRPRRRRPHPRPPAATAARAGRLAGPQRRGHLRDPPLDPCRNHHHRRPAGPLHPQGPHRLRHRPGRRPRRRPHHPRPDPPPGSQIGVLHGTADLAWTQAANDVRITPPPRPPSPHAQVLTITTS
jgi:hypothetical protein